MQKSGQMTILKDLCAYLLLYQPLYDLTDRTVCNLKLVFVRTNALGRNLISVFDLTYSLGRNLISVLDLTNPLGRRLISALVLKSHLKCLLILLCLAASFFNSPRLLLFSISLIFAINPTAELFGIYIRMDLKLKWKHKQKLHSDQALKSSHA